MPDIKRVLKLDLPEGKSAFLWGPRQAGKSTFLKQHFPDSLYYDLLDTEQYYRLLEKPYLLRQEITSLPKAKLDSPIIIDEVQKIPILLDEVHSMIERMKPISFILCGSSTRKLRATGANFLGGRAWRYLFTPLVFPELTKFDLLHIFQTGLLPTHYLNPQEAKRSIKSYVNDYLLQELQQEGSVRNLRVFLRFLEIMAYIHGEIINYANIARDCGVDAKTVRGYFEILQDMFLGDFVEVFSTKTGRDIVTAHPRFYFFDVGIANYLCGRNIIAIKGKEAGRAFEHYIYYEINSYKQLNELDFPIQYWRTRTGLEVDFILGQGKLAIESKMTTAVQKSDIKNLIAFKKYCPHSNLYIVCLEPRKRLVEIEGQKILIWPIEEFLKTLWAGEIIAEK